MKAQTAPQQGTRGTVTTPSAASNCVLSCCCGDFQLENTRKFHISTYFTNRWNCPSTVTMHMDTQAHINTCVYAHSTTTMWSLQAQQGSGDSKALEGTHQGAISRPSGSAVAPLGLVAPSSVSWTQDRDACPPSSQGADFTPSRAPASLPRVQSQAPAQSVFLGGGSSHVHIDPTDLTDGHTAHMYHRAGIRPRAGVPASCHPQSSFVSLLLPK